MSTAAYQEVQDQLNYAGVNLNASASEVIHASKGTAESLARASEKFSKSYQDFQERGLILAGQLKVCLYDLLITRCYAISDSFYEEKNHKLT